MNKARSALARDITLILIIKVIALFLIWLAWFSGPEKKPGTEEVGKSLITPPQPAHAQR
ncbi:MAG: cytochrome oxidase putative small subunit CydP [Burkholderiales bacterium]